MWASMLRCWSKIAPRLCAEAEQLMKVLPMVRPLMLGCGPKGALRNSIIIFLSLSLSLLSAIHCLMQSKRASLREMGVRSISEVKGQIEPSVVNVELDMKAVLSHDCRNGC